METAGSMTSLSRTKRKARERAKILQEEKQESIQTDVLELKLHKTQQVTLKRKLEEVFDDPDELKLKVKQLATAIRKAKHLVVYTGAGISTVLKKYACLWSMNRAPSKRQELYIVNLQWTPKDDLAVLKIHGKCDNVLKLLMEELNIECQVCIVNQLGHLEYVLGL